MVLDGLNTAAAFCLEPALQSVTTCLGILVVDLNTASVELTTASVDSLEADVTIARLTQEISGRVGILGWVMLLSDLNNGSGLILHSSTNGKRGAVGEWLLSLAILSP